MHTIQTMRQRQVDLFIKRKVVSLSDLILILIVVVLREKMKEICYMILY